MAPVMVWVVDTGMPAAEVTNSVAAAADSAATPPDGLEAGDLRAHRLHDAPAAGEGAEADGGVGGEHHPQRHVGVGGQVAGGDEQGEDDAHRLLGVVGAVAEAEGGRRHELAAPEALVQAVEPLHAVEDPRDERR